MLVKFLLLTSLVVVLSGGEVKCDENGLLGKGLFSDEVIEEGKAIV